MKTLIIFTLSVTVGAAMSCGHRTLSSAASGRLAQMQEVSRKEVIDSTALSRKLHALIRQPKIMIVSGGMSGDTSVVMISAADVIIGDSVELRSKTVATAIDTVDAKKSDYEEAYKKTSAPTKSWAWILLSFVALAAIIVRSWPGIGFRR